MMTRLFIASRAPIEHDGSRRIIADGRVKRAGTGEDAAALAAVVRAGRRAWAATSHPEHLIVPCPRPGCDAEVGEQCSTTGGTVLPWGHRERHAAAIAADGRTCAAGRDS